MRGFIKEGFFQHCTGESYVCLRLQYPILPIYLYILARLISIGGLEVGQYLLDQCDSVHITGSDKTFDAIVWGMFNWRLKGPCRL